MSILARLFHEKLKNRMNIFMINDLQINKKIQFVIIMIFQLFHPTGESGALYLVVLPRHAVVTTAMSYQNSVNLSD